MRLVQIDTEMALKGLVTVTFDCLTLKLVCESHLRWGTFILNLGMLGLWILELFAMYATDGQTDRRSNKRTEGHCHCVKLTF